MKNFIKSGIKRKLIFYTLPVMIFVYLFSVGYITISLSNKAIRDAHKLANRYVIQVASDVKAKINEDLGIVRGIAHSLSEYQGPPEERESYLFKSLQAILKNEKAYYSTWASLELQHFEPEWEYYHGRKRFTFYQEGAPKIDSVNLDGDQPGSLYHNLKISKKESITDPYYLSEYSTGHDVRDEVFGTSICVPILIKDQFAGMAGIDITLDFFNYIAELKPFEQTNLFLISNDGTIITSTQSHLQGKNIDLIFNEILPDADVKNKISKGLEATFRIAGENKKIIEIVPIKLGHSDLPWAIGIIIPEEVILKEVKQIVINIILISILGLALFSVATYKIADKIILPLKRVNHLIKQIALGNTSLKFTTSDRSNDEVNEIGLSANLFAHELNAKEEFAKAIGEGKLSMDYKPISDEDSLGKSLLLMRDNLKLTKIKEEERNWATHGLAKFADVMRSNNEDTDTFYNMILGELVKYIEANQGMLFLLQEEGDNHYLELVAAYAYNRRKFIQSRIEVGEGLAGQCFLEKEMIYLTDIPRDYVKITSGLGEATPKNVILVPLKLEETVVGVLELASFSIFDQYKIEFLEKLAESFASTVSNTLSNSRTKQLLKDSQIQSEQLKAQEEEIRQNMEELESTQEEMLRSQKRMQESLLLMDVLINATGDSVVAFDTQYNIILINDVLIKRYAGTPYEMNVGDNLLERLGKLKDEWLPHYEKVLRGQSLTFTIKSQLKNEENLRWYNLQPIRDNEGIIKYAVVISRDLQVQTIKEDVG